ncbi:MAG TPA: TIGR00730 family Rossman fold protein [Gemmatales bacterium]|nr:TIGR00730 family Rossman fold protein [Gemmatales bacterium]HMP58870.1 TIGR00730 family Rossman fold protein [Gemmatales bacterium]
MRRIAVFCGARVGQSEVYAAAARSCGRLLAERGVGLVFGGGHIGLMGVVADAALAAGGEAIGVIPRSMVESELAHEGVTRLEIVETMHQRKARMAELADAFIALPGGYGTLDELFEILTWAQLRLHAKPIGLCNVAGYFDPLLAWIDHALAEGFVAPRHRALVRVAAEPGLLIDELLAEVG